MARDSPTNAGMKVPSGTMPAGSVARNMPATAVTMSSMTTPGLVRAR